MRECCADWSPPDVRILLAIPSLRCGGSERVMSILASYWAGRGHDVALATFEPAETDFFPLDTRVRRFEIGETGAAGVGWLRANRERRQALREVVRDVQPDVVLSFLYTMNLLAIMAARDLAPVIVAERTDPRYFPVERWQSAARRVLYPRAAAVVVQTEDVLDGWAQRVARGAPAFAVPNPALSPAESAEWAGTPLPERFVASVGRLERGKGFDVLIDAFARIAPGHPNWSLVILGEGEERDRLQTQAAALQLGERVLLPGIGDTSALLGHAEVFATASRVEGFPNGLLEAMAHGLPVVATDCHSGPREILSDGADGYLTPVDNAGALAEALDQLLADEGLRRELGGRASGVLERYGLERVASRWEDVFAAVLT
jgi:GalNAc-alpha-(1->4)-GalNAc-alpha-(1->3)-diNAcBac-PP-undecaprenol alpha-1,4-N-acetyl-D-galactosaminyltransferase